MMLGAVITALGIAALVMSGGIRYFRRDAVPHNGSAHITVKDEKIFSVSPLVAGAVLVAGIGVMIAAARK